MGKAPRVTIARDPAAPLGQLAFEQDPVRWMERCPAFTRPQQQRSRDALARIVTAAVALFGQKGFAATRVSDIAEAAQVPVGTVYKHFADKQALLDGIVTGYRACRMREIRALCRSEAALAATPRELVELHLDIVFSAFTVDAGLLRLIERQRLEDPVVHRQQSDANDAVASEIAELLVARMPERDADALRRQVHYLHAIVRGAVVWSTLPAEGELGAGLKVTDGDFAAEALAMALRYLGIPEA